MDDNSAKLQEEQSVIFDSVPAWIFYKDKENRFIRVNKAFCDAMGKSKEELEGKSLFDIFPKEQADAFWKDDKEVVASGVAKKNIVEEAQTSQGKIWLQTDKIPYRDEQGEIIGVIGFAIDITDRKKAEEEKDKSQIMLQKIIDLLPVRIFWKDKELHYLGCNKVFAEDAGKQSPEELIGKDDYQMGWKDQADLYRKDDMGVIQSCVPKINYEEDQTTPDGHQIWLNTNKVPIINDKGEVQGVLGTYIDITERKLADDKLKAALAETKRMNDLMVGRELKMVEMKNKIKELDDQKNK
jgi:PAS domain S-box-containing protein